MISLVEGSAPVSTAIDTLGGLPAHPAVVHLPVVMVPLAFVLTLLVLWPRARTWALPTATGAAVLGLFGALLAGSTGEALEESVRRTPLVRDHVNTAEQVNLFLVPFVLFLCVLLVAHWARNDSFPFASRLTPLTRRLVPRLASMPARVTTVLLALAVLTGALASWKTYDAGHSGAKSVWHDVRIVPGHGGDDD
ncbi:MAG: DUF2231 domain-containing protein [Acidimicrobiales bacterium]